MLRERRRADRRNMSGRIEPPNCNGIDRRLIMSGVVSRPGGCMSDWIYTCAPWRGRNIKKSTLVVKTMNEYAIMLIGMEVDHMWRTRLQYLGSHCHHIREDRHRTRTRRHIPPDGFRSPSWQPPGRCTRW
jgi:hypothetical protein